MNNKDTLFYRGNKAVSIDFSTSEIGSDGSLILPEKIEREYQLVNKFSNILSDLRNQKN